MTIREEANNVPPATHLNVIQVTLLFLEFVFNFEHSAYYGSVLRDIFN
jgi:hypothetical protein